MTDDAAPPRSCRPLHPPPRLVRWALRSVLIVLCLVLWWAMPGTAGADGAGGGGGARWQWPLPPPHQVVAPFEAPAHDYGPGHRGIDIAVASGGVEVRAVEAGTVRFSGQVAGRGVVSVRHADGLLSTYEPVVGALNAGERVEAGQVVGSVAEAGESVHCPGSVCLHLGARRGDDYLDPMVLLGVQGPSVLLPWGGGGWGAPVPAMALSSVGLASSVPARSISTRSSPPCSPTPRWLRREPA